MPKISFLILTYNSSDYIKPFFDSLFEKVDSKIKDGIYELLILDNASSDSSTLQIHNYFKGRDKKNISINISSMNLGYAAGINKIAKKAKGEVLVIINPDAELIEENFEKLISEFEENKKMSIAGLKIIDKNGKKEKNAGNFFNPLTFLLYSVGFESVFNLRFATQKKQKVDFVSGGFVAFRKSTFDKLSGFDEDFFMYVEDMELALRVKELGLETYILPYATIKHYGQGSSDREFAIVNIYKGLQVFFEKHKGFLEVWYIKNLLGLKAIIIIFIAAILGRKETAHTYKKALQTIV
jgi:GT2 family glycosyltransferase